MTLVLPLLYLKMKCKFRAQTSESFGFINEAHILLCHSIWWTGYFILTYIHSLNNQHIPQSIMFCTNLKSSSEGGIVYAFCCLPDLGFGKLCDLIFSPPIWSCHGSALGCVPSPFDCFLCNRGLKTLHLRMECHFKNAMAAAKFLEADPRVEKVIFPGKLSL